jgi:O-methyltransferase
MLDPTLIERVAPLSKQSPERLRALALALDDLKARRIAGAVVECGAWRGATAILTRIIAPERPVWLYDTFDGMTAPDPAIDISHLSRPAWRSYRIKLDRGDKWSKATRAEVIANLEAFGIRDGVFMVEGDVCQTLIDPRLPLPEPIALLRLDTDFYQSTKVELAVLYPRLAKGGVLIIDDYGHWLGCRRAVNEYFGFVAVDMWHWSRFTQIDATAVMLIKR